MLDRQADVAAVLLQGMPSSPAPPLGLPRALLILGDRASAGRARLLRAILERVHSERAASWLFAIRPRIFGREQAAVVAGRRRYLDDQSDLGSRFLLRRNVHMLEKGLSMQPRRDVFAVDYIERTVDTFATLRADEQACADDRELQWANDVLAAYFDAVQAHPVVDRARARFAPLPLGRADRGNADFGLSPYKRDLAAPHPVSYEQLHDLAKRRRSVRTFLPRPVPRDLISRALDVALLSPSACNRQPFRFQAFDDPAQVKAAADIPMGTRGWGKDAPMFIVVVGTLSAFFSERDRHVIYTDASLAIMSFVLALETLGLSSCCVNWPDIPDREARMAEMLRLEPHERPVMCIAVGYPDPDGIVPFSSKRAVDTMVDFNL